MVKGQVGQSVSALDQGLGAYPLRDIPELPSGKRTQAVMVQGTEIITKLDVAHKAPQSLQPPLAFMPKASQMKSQRKYYGTCGVISH